MARCAVHSARVTVPKNLRRDFARGVDVPAGRPYHRQRHKTFPKSENKIPFMGPDLEQKKSYGLCKSSRTSHL